MGGVKGECGGGQHVTHIISRGREPLAQGSLIREGAPGTGQLN